MNLHTNMDLTLFPVNDFVNVRLQMIREYTPNKKSQSRRTQDWDFDLAEREGFEPSHRLPGLTI